MANIKLIIPKILKWEGGFGHDKADPGGATNKGITLDTWKSYGYDIDGDGDIDVYDLKALSNLDFEYVLKLNFWDRWRADYIKTQSIAELLVDWVWASGKYGIVEPQKLLGVTADGLVGALTINAINNYHNQEELHNKIFKGRMDFIDRITAYNIETYKTKGFPKQGIKANPNPTEKDLLTDTFKRFQQGWKNRLNDSYKLYQP